MKETVNIFEAEPIEGRIDLGSLAGSSETAAFVYDIAPGESSSPYHYEYEEEWLLVLDGRRSSRAPDGERTLERGDLVRFPAGPAGAHKIMNRGESSCADDAVLSARAPAVSVYPDSDKIGDLAGGDGEDDAHLQVAAPPCRGREGEEGWNRA